MIPARRLSGLLPLLLLMACTWPDTGGGGMAEIRAPKPEKEAIATPLQLRLICEVDRTDLLREGLAKRGVLTGRFRVVNDLSVRAQREYYGGLFADSARSLDALHAEIALFGQVMPTGMSLPPECPPP